IIQDSLSSADLVLLVGDLTTGGVATDASRVVDAVRRYNRSILAVPGNWDGPEISEYLDREGINLHAEKVVLGGITFIGVGASLPAIDAPNEILESDFESFLGKAVSGIDPAKPKILVCHQPPIRTVTDKLWNGSYAGSETIRTFIETMQPLVCFTGHIHEGKGIDRIGNTRIINPGPLWEGGFAYAEISGQKIEILEIRECENHFSQ
ncbi:MAG: serine/threonine protein phosphatase, partial [bacterium]|nr:serine/threonine protein phosphatase [bacterium]